MTERTTPSRSSRHDPQRTRQYEDGGQWGGGGVSSEGEEWGSAIPHGQDRQPPVEVPACVCGDGDPVVGPLHGMGRVQQPAEKTAAGRNAFGSVNQFSDQAQKVPLSYCPGAACCGEVVDKSTEFGLREGDSHVLCVEHAVQQFHSCGRRAAFLYCDRDVAALTEGKEGLIGMSTGVGLRGTDEEIIIKIVMDVGVPCVVACADGEDFGKVVKYRAGRSEAEGQPEVDVEAALPLVTQQPPL